MNIPVLYDNMNDSTIDSTSDTIPLIDNTKVNLVDIYKLIIKEEALIEYVNIVSSMFEIRLNPHKKQDLFENLEIVNCIRKLILRLNDMDTTLYKFILENSNKQVYIYYKDNMFYRFDPSHYNFRLKQDLQYICRIDGIENNNILVSCKKYEDESIIIKKIPSHHFIDMVVDIYQYEENILTIFTQ